MPNSYGRAFTTANFLANLAALKEVNFGSSDPLGTWFVVPNPTTNNIEIWVWEPASILATNEIDVIRPNSVVSNAPGRCLQRLKFDASSLGGILAAIAALNTVGLIERTTTGAAATVPVTTFAKTLLDDADAIAARATIGLNFVNNTADATKSVASAATLTTGRTINGVLFNGSANITINATDTILRIPASEKGVAGGVAPLNPQNQIPAIHLPSYVDDVLEFATLAQFPVAANAESGKIYVDIATNLSYRWTGTIYAALDPSLALGTTSQTAYRGDFGNAAYQHALFTGNPHGTTAANVGLGNVANTAQVDLVSNQTIGGSKIFAQPITASGNIVFASTQNASVNPNTLDDYEEGVWTPVLTYTTPGTSSIGLSRNTGRYQKVGNRVTITFDIRVSTFSKGTASGFFIITGLPFPTRSGGGFDNNYGFLVVGNSPFTGIPFLDTGNGISGGNTYIFIFKCIPSAVNQPLEDPIVGALYWGQLQYETNS